MLLSPDQQEALHKLTGFLQPDYPKRVFVLRGSAGTGKTSLVRMVLDNVPDDFEDIATCAFTNKAAKVLTSKTGRRSTTLHRLLYTFDEDPKTQAVRVIRRKIDPEKPTLVIVDEASMVGDRTAGRAGEIFESTALLTDLLQFLFQGHGANRLIFVGDPCQLPPIGYESHESAPALDLKYLSVQKSLSAEGYDLTTVHRQQEGSYILDSATNIRDHLLYQATSDIRWTAKMLDNPSAAIRQYLDAFSAEDDSRVSLLAWMNKDVNWWNNTLRARFGLSHHPLALGTRVFIDRNWSDGSTVVYKGETGIVTACSDEPHTFAGLRFLDVRIQSTDMTGDSFEIEAKAMLDHLESDSGFINPERERQLRHDAHKHNRAYSERSVPWNDPFVGALRLRYGYALTCHKAQGSEYNNVILHPFYPKADKRWLYTAITRAKQELYMFRRA